MYKRIGALFFILSFQPMQGQLPSADTSGYHVAANTFLQAVSLQKGIYNGIEHVGYLPGIEGFAYYETSGWQRGSLLYDGILYQNEWLQYDLVKDKVVLKRFDGFPLELRSEKVDYFTLQGDTFINVKSNDKSAPKKGFYKRVVAGPLTILSRHTKVFEEKLEGVQLRQKFNEATAYYAVTDNRYYPARNAAAVLALTGTWKNDIQQHLKRNKIKYKNNPGLTLLTIAELYNKTKP